MSNEEHDYTSDELFQIEQVTRDLLGEPLLLKEGDPIYWDGATGRIDDNRLGFFDSPAHIRPARPSDPGTEVWVVRDFELSVDAEIIRLYIMSSWDSVGGVVVVLACRADEVRVARNWTKDLNDITRDYIQTRAKQMVDGVFKSSRLFRKIQANRPR